MSEIEWNVRQGRDQLHVTAQGSNGRARMSARWQIGKHTVADAPERVTVTANDGGKVTTTVLRDAEPLLVAMTSELGGILAEQDRPDPMQAIREDAQALPSTPRGDPLYYRRLLAIFDAMTKAGVRSPVKEFCRITGRPEGTVKTQLSTARRVLGPPAHLREPTSG